MNGTVHKKIDIRGVACPMNYVKILMALDELKVGERLEAILDDGKALVDVPRSAKEDGHKVLKVTAVGDAYSVIIGKGE